jgi:hypothetical protein
MSTVTAEQLLQAIVKLTTSSNAATTYTGGESFDNYKDMDTFHTGLKRFDSRYDSIFGYISTLGEHLGNRADLSHNDKAEIFLDRMGVTLATKIRKQVPPPTEYEGDEDTDPAYYNAVRRAACLFLTPHGYEQMKRDIDQLKQGSANLQDFWTQFEHKWNEYAIYYNIAHDIDTSDRQQQQFWDTFLAALHPEEREFLDDQITEDKLKRDWCSMPQFLHRWATKFTRFHTTRSGRSQPPTTIPEQSLQGQTNTPKFMYNNMSNPEKTTNEHFLADVATSLQRTQETALERLGTCINNATNHMFNHVKSSHDRDSEALFTRFDQLYRTTPPNPPPVQSQQINNMSDRGRPREPQRYPQDRRDRSPSPFRGQPRDRRDRSRSEPRQPECYKCTNTGHWSIACQFNKHMDTEREIFRKIKGATRYGRAIPSLESDLRSEHKCPDRPGQPNRTLQHDQESVVTGTGRYCAWEHTKGHATDLCPNFCSICEKDGHYWGNCTADPAFANQRKEAWKGYLASIQGPPYT